MFRYNGLRKFNIGTPLRETNQFLNVYKLFEILYGKQLLAQLQLSLSEIGANILQTSIESNVRCNSELGYLYSSELGYLGCIAIKFGLKLEELDFVQNAAKSGIFTRLTTHSINSHWSVVEMHYYCSAFTEYINFEDQELVYAIQEKIQLGYASGKAKQIRAAEKLKGLDCRLILTDRRKLVPLRNVNR
jgi:hypothetical protein